MPSCAALLGKAEEELDLSGMNHDLNRISLQLRHSAGASLWRVSQGSSPFRAWLPCFIWLHGEPTYYGLGAESDGGYERCGAG